jgi:hypothetical protein
MLSAATGARRAFIARRWALTGPPTPSGHLRHHRLPPIDGADHFMILETLARPDGELIQALLTLVRSKGRCT